MDADELLSKLAANGADEKGINDRFGGNLELYKYCFFDFLEESSFATLRDAISTGDYDRAFGAAHALKGLSGNLGITVFYNTITALVESLRNKEYSDVDAQYAAVARLHEQLRRLASDEARDWTPEETEQPGGSNGEGLSPKSPEDILEEKNRRLFRNIIFAAIALIIAVCLLFLKVNSRHKQKVLEESSEHLVEMTRQICLYVEEQIATDWRIAESVGDSILDVQPGGGDAAVLHVLQRKKSVWNVTDIMLFTENGHCVYSDGSTEMNGIASDMLYNAERSGRYMSIINSRLIYTIPLESEQLYAGSKIAAISVVRDVASFLDDMDFSSFEGKAWVYLTDPTGVIISSLTNPSTKNVFNIQAAVEGMTITPLDADCTPEDFVLDLHEAAFLIANGTGYDYGVSAPIFVDAKPLHLFYFVPEDVVNNTLNGFSRELITFSMVIILIMTSCAMLVSWYAYKSRKQLFDRAIMTRERMFDLLVRNTRTAFGMLSVDHPKPDYTSDNVPEVVGDKYWSLSRSASGYRICNEKGEETENLTRVNELLRDWDGVSVFRSGYLRNGQSNSAPYFQFELYPVGNNGRDFVAIAQDVTQAHAREETAKDAMEMATRSNEAKTRFLSNMSHDIRTPMNAIMNMTNFALESIDNPKRLGPYLHTIREAAEHLLQLINDVLEVSRIESGQMVVASAPFDIKGEIQRQADMIRPLCEAKSQTLMTDLSGIGVSAVCGDALKVSQVVINLLSNAMKFTPERGAVRLTARELPSLRDGIVNIRITVEDTGMGIPEADRKLIFEPFSRAENKEVKKIEGTGLGLSICKSYVEAMGGTLRCESELGEGSTFTVELFFQEAVGKADEDEVGWTDTGDLFLGMRCLVAEDNITNQLIAGELLRRMGFIVDFADDGSGAVQLFLSSKPGMYDVIYMDIQMPVMNGYEATARIRACGHPQADTIPIVAMSANAFAEDIERARVSGMDAYVEKPVVSFNLAEQTMKALRKKHVWPEE